MPNDIRQPKSAPEEAEMRQTLLRAAEIVARVKIHPAPLPGDQAVEFDSAVDAGLINITDDHISFATTELLVTWIASHCAMNISNVWHDLTLTTKELRASHHLSTTLELPKSYTTQLLVSLENDCGKSVLLRLAETARIQVGDREANAPLNALYFAFCDALPELDYQPTDLADHLAPVLSATENYFPPGKLHGAIERLASQSQEKAEALFRAFLQEPERRTADLAANALKAIWTFDPSEAHRQAMELTEAKPPVLVCIGIITLSWFDYELPSHQQELTSTTDRLEELCESSNSKVLSAIAQGFGALVAAPVGDYNLQRIREGLLRLASHEDPDVQFVVASVLLRRTDDSGDADWFWDTLSCLTGVPACYMGTLDELDLATSSMVDRYPERVTKHLEGVVTSRPYGTEGEKASLPDIYENTIISLIGKQQPILEATITRWFASRDSHLHAAAADVVGCFARGAQHETDHAIQLDSVELNACDEVSVQRVIFALAGHVDDPRALASLLISVLSRKPVSECVRELIVGALVDVVLYNLPGDAGDYLRDCSRHADTPEHVRNVIEESLRHSDAYYERLRERPRLKEVMPPDIRVHRYLSVFEQQARSFREDMLNESPILSTIPKTPLKYGRAWFSAEDGNLASANPLSTIRSKSELQRHLVIDSVGRRIIRMNCRLRAMQVPPGEPPSDVVNDCQTANEEKEAKKS